METTKKVKTIKTAKTNGHAHPSGKSVSHSFLKGMHKLDDAQTAVKEYTHVLWTKAHKKPMTSALIVGGISVIIGGVSMLVYSLFKRK